MPVGVALYLAAYQSVEPSAGESRWRVALADPLGVAGVIVVGIGLGSLALWLLIRESSPRLKIQVPPAWPMNSKEKEIEYLKKGRFPYQTDFRNDGGRSRNVYYLPMTVVNKGSAEAPDVRAQVTRINPTQPDRPPDLYWRRASPAQQPSMTHTLPPRGGNNEVYLLEWEQFYGGGVNILLPWQQWQFDNETAVIDVRVWCQGARARKVRIRLDRVQHGGLRTPTATRLRWWNRE